MAGERRERRKTKKEKGRAANRVLMWESVESSFASRWASRWLIASKALSIPASP